MLQGKCKVPSVSTSSPKGTRTLRPDLVVLTETSSIHRKQQVQHLISQSINIPPLMDSEVSLTCSQKPAHRILSANQKNPIRALISAYDCQFIFFFGFPYQNSLRISDTINRSFWYADFVFRDAFEAKYSSMYPHKRDHLRRPKPPFEKRN